MNIREYFISNNGYAKMKAMKEDGFQTRTISKALKDNIIEKIKPGLYKLFDYDWDENSSFIDIYNVKKEAVICLSSALHYYNLSTINPEVIHVAVPHNTARFTIDYPPVKVFFYSNSTYPLEINTVKVGKSNFNIYSIEKTLCDSFRYRTKIGEDIFLEALKNYLNLPIFNLNKLYQIAKQCKIDKKIEPYIKAMVIE